MSVNITQRGCKIKFVLVLNHSEHEFYFPPKFKMPFLKRQPFERQKPPQDLDPEEELFHCKLTNEVFRDYEEFFERVILCNSLVWTCELTGRPGLTYQEALDSEERARKSLAAFPESMKRPILFLSSFTKRGRLADMCDDVSAFVKQRFLKGEEVEVSINGQKLTCQILDVVPPDPSLVNGHKEVKVEAEISIEQEPSNEGSDKKVQVGLDPLLYKYIVKELNSAGKKHTVAPGDVARKKGGFNRDRNKLFLRQYCEPRDAIWKLKPSTISTFNIGNFTFSDIFAGPLPSFATTRRKQHISPNKDIEVNGVPPVSSKPKPSDKKQADRTDKGKGEKVTKEVKKSTKPVPAVTMDDIEQLRKQLEDRRREREEEKQKQKEEKEKERERKREERRVRDEEIRLWLKPRDDLECDDLKDIPSPTPVKCGIPNELFGDIVMVLEFLHTFGPALGLKDFFPQGITFEHLEVALTEKDVNSSLSEIFQFFLEALFGLQESEEAVQGHLRTDSKDISDLCDDDPDLTMAQALQAATAAAAWPQRHQGMLLKQLPLDQYTLTEVLRLHLLSLGGHADYIDYRNSVARGNYTVRDDPALQLRFDDPALLKALSTRTVFDFSPAEKLQLLQVLMGQLLTFMTVRNQIEETFNNTKTARMELKQMQWAEQRQEREEAAARAKKLMEERIQMEEMIQNQAEDENSSNIKQEENLDQTVVNLENDSIVKQEKDDQPEVKQEKEAIKPSLEDPKAQQKEAQRKLEFHRKERELLDAISKLQAEGGIQPLGRDRAYRRFWVFNSVPGLFVESDDSFVGSCLPEPTVQNPNSNPYLAHLKEDNNPVNSDKENKVTVNPLGAPPLVVNKQHKLLSDNHPVVVVEKLNHSQYLVSTDDKFSASAVYSATAKSSVFGMCTATDGCPVHGSGREQRTRWAFYSNSDELDRVFHSLNPRGIREGALRESLNSERQRLLSSLNRCPVQHLNCDYSCVDGESQTETRKTSRRSVPTKAGKKPSLPVEDEMEVTLREMLLDIEERIYNGSLGDLKVSDRVAWREALHSRTYISSCEVLKWGRKQDKCLDVDSDSGRGTPMELMEQESSSHRSSSPIPTNQMVKDLASALLQIEQSVESKYLKPPFGVSIEAKKPRTRNSEADKKKLKKEKGEVGKDVDSELSSGTKVTKMLLARWEESLMSSTSLSQIYVHMSTLERSITWSRSALNAECRICRRRGDAEHMLLCDDCDCGHHMYCLKPPLTAIPEGDWYCIDCKPRQPLKGTRSAPKVSSETEEEEEDSDGLEGSEDESEEADSDYDDEDEEDEVKSSEGDNQNLCKACKKPGTLICCDNCPLSFHLDCVKPPLRRVPRGRWDCPHCMKKTKAKRQGKRTSSSVQVEEPPVKRTRRSDRNISAAESEDEIWLSGRRKQGPAVRRGASRDVPVDYKLCDQILLELTRHDCSWPFLRPVGRKQVPQYYEVITRPVDLASMRGKLSDMEYRTTKDFILEVMLMLQNCIMYNSVDSPEYKAADKLSKYFETYTQQLGFSSIEDLVNSGCCSSTPSSPDPLAKQAGRNSRRT